MEEDDPEKDLEEDPMKDEDLEDEPLEDEDPEEEPLILEELEEGLVGEPLEPKVTRWKWGRCRRMCWGTCPMNAPGQ